MSAPRDSAPDARPPRHGLAAFSHRAFALYWFAGTLETVGIEMLLTAVAWQVYALTGRELDLGLVGLARFVPFALLFLVSGLAADRLPRTRIMAGCMALQGVCAAALLAMTLSGEPRFAAILGVLVAFGVARAFLMPVQQSIVPVLVPADTFANAIVWAGTGNKFARVAGPALGGLLIAGGGEAGEALAYAVAAALLATGCALMTQVRAPRQAIAREPVSIRSVFAGLRFIVSRRVILAALSLDLFAVLVGGGAATLLPVFARDILQVGPDGFGALRAATMAGALAAGFFLMRWPVTCRGGTLLLGTTAIFGLGGLVFGMSHSFLLSLTALAVMGAANMVSVIIRHALVQQTTPDEMRGRVGAAVGVFLGASNDLGALEAGVTAHWWGAVPAVLVGGVATVGIAALFAWRFPVLRRVDRLDADSLVRRYAAPHDRHGAAVAA